MCSRTAWLASRVVHMATSASSPDGVRWRVTNWTSSSPAPEVVGRTRWTRELISSAVRSIVGQT